MEVKRRTAKQLIAKLSSVSEQSRIEALCEIRLLTKGDPEIRTIIADEGAIPFIAETLYAPASISQENAAATLLNLSITTRESIISTRGALDALSHALRSPSTCPAAVQAAAATIYSLLIDESYRRIIGSKRDIIYALIDIIKNPDSPARSIKDALKALFGVALYPPNRSSMIELGAVSPLFSLVVVDGRVGVVEDATAVIAQIAGWEESPESFKKISGIGVLVDLIDPSTGSSARTKENAISALLNLVRCGGDKVKDDVKGLEFRLFDGIADVMESGSPKGKNKATALMKLLDGGVYMNVSRDSKSDSCINSRSVFINHSS